VHLIFILGFVHLNIRGEVSSKSPHWGWISEEKKKKKKEKKKEKKKKERVTPPQVFFFLLLFLLLLGVHLILMVVLR